MIGMRGAAGGHHTGKVTGGNGVGRSTTQALALVLAVDAAFGQRQAAGAMAQFLQQVP
jgi:predicted protein tyrosine phosphatase